MIRSPQFTSRLMAAVLAVCGVAASTGALANEAVTVQLKWVPQAQFAGYYMAAAKGFYKDAGLDVTIKPGGPDIAPTQVLAGKQADIVVDWMPSAMASREAGVPLVNVAQVFDKSGLMLTCKKKSGVTTPKDFKGKTLGVWYGGNEYPFLNWMNKLGYKTDSDIKILKQGFNVDPLLQDQAACISTMIYNEYWQVVDAGVKEKDLVTFFYEKEGVSTLEDGLYVLEPNLKDPAFVARMGKFLKATQLIDNLTWASGIDDSGRPVVIPGKDPTAEGNWVCPSVKGGTNWMGQSFNPGTGLLYILTQEECGMFTLSNQKPVPMKNFAGGAATEPGGPVILRAIDPKNGKRVWQYPVGNTSRMWTGVVTTATGVLFSGDDDGHLIALEAKTGRHLWHYNVGDVITASPIIYAVDGKEYVSIAAGTNVFSFGLFEPAQSVPIPVITMEK